MSVASRCLQPISPQTRKKLFDTNVQGALFPIGQRDGFGSSQIMIEHFLYLRAEIGPDHHRVDFLVV